MLIAVHDASMKKVGFLDNESQGALNFYNDTWSRYLETGTSTFEFTVDKQVLETDTANYRAYQALSERSFVSFKYKGKSYLFNVMKTTEDSDSITCYCENLTLELLNEYANAYEADKAYSFVEYCNRFGLLKNSALTIGVNEVSDQKRKITWTGQDTLLKRLLSLANYFNAEISFDSYLKDDSTLKEFRINIYKENDATHQGVGQRRTDVILNDGEDISKITKTVDKTVIFNAVSATGNDRTVTHKVTKTRIVNKTITVPSGGATNTANALRNITSRKGQHVGSGQCYALSALYSSLLGGPGLGGGVTGLSGLIGAGIAASNIGTDYNWGAFGWGVERGAVDKVKAGAIANIKANYGAPFYTGPFGHTAIIKSVSGSTVTVLEQNYAGRMYVVENSYNLNAYAAGIQTLCYPPELARGGSIDGSTVTKTVPTTETYTEDVKETVKTVIPAGRKEWKNEAGEVEFYTENGTIYAPISRKLYPSVLSGTETDDNWIRKDITVNTDSEDVLVSTALKELRNNCYALIKFEIDGDSDLDIGDTVKAKSSKFHPMLLLEVRVSELHKSFTDPDNNKVVYSNYKQLKNNVSSDLIAQMEQMADAAKPYEIKLASSNGVIFKNHLGTSVITPTLLKGGKVIFNDVTYRFAVDGSVTTGLTYTIQGTDIQETSVLTVSAYIGNDEVATTEISLANVMDGKLGEPGKNGTIVHVAWSNSADGTIDFDLESDVNKTYRGEYQDYTIEDSTDPKKYKWVKVKGDKGEKGDRGPQGERGLQGLQGAKGDQGIAGAKGADGRTQYTHIAYSDSADGSTNFSVSASNRKYIGMYVDFTSADSTNPADYAWTLVKGADGANGTPGKTGADGRTPYFHTAYANSYDGQQDFSVTDSANKKYLGTYTDYTQSDSTDYRVYTWTLIKGDDGTGIANVTNYYLATNQSTGVTLPTTRNLALGTSADWNTFKTITSTTGSNLSASLHKIINDGLVVGDTLHIYLEISADYPVAFNSSSNTTMLIQTYGDVTDWDNDGRLFNRSSERITVATNNPKKYEFNITLTEKMLKNNFWWLGVRFDGISSVKYHTKAVKVEKGTVGTPWEAALEDLGWTTTPQQLSYTKRFLWNYRIELYTDGTTKTTEPTVIGVHGEKGDQGERGLQGLQGEKGDKGIQGEKGTDGKSSYTHIAYATNSTGTQGFSVSDSTNKTYIGMYVDNVEADSTIPSKYNWTLVKGADGAQGVPGAKGSDGRTPYIHFAYANSADGRTDFSTTQTGNKRYLGTYTDFTQNDSTDPTKYKWVDMVGTVEVSHRNLAIGSSDQWNNFITISSNNNWCAKLATVLYGDSTGIYAGTTINIFVYLSADDIVLDSTINPRFFIQGAVIDKQNKVTWTDWDKYNPFYNKWSTNLAAGNNYRIVKITSKVTAESYANIKGFELAVRIDGVNSGKFHWRALMITTGTAFPSYWTKPIEDTQSEVDSKADQVLTQEQLNALNEKAGIIQAELEAKATAKEVAEWVLAYKKFVDEQKAGRQASEKALIDASNRVSQLEWKVGDMKQSWQFIDSYMTASNEGLIIGKYNASEYVKISSGRVSFFSGNSEVMYISQGVLNIDNGIFTKSVQIGRFRFEAHPSNQDMLVLRYIGG